MRAVVCLLLIALALATTRVSTGGTGVRAERYKKKDCILKKDAIRADKTNTVTVSAPSKAIRYQKGEECLFKITKAPLKKASPVTLKDEVRVEKKTTVDEFKDAKVIEEVKNEYFKGERDTKAIASPVMFEASIGGSPVLPFYKFLLHSIRPALAIVDTIKEADKQQSIKAAAMRLAKSNQYPRKNAISYVKMWQPEGGFKTVGWKAVAPENNIKSQVIEARTDKMETVVAPAVVPVNLESEKVSEEYRRKRQFVRKPFVPHVRPGCIPGMKWISRRAAIEEEKEVVKQAEPTKQQVVKSESRKSNNLRSDSTTYTRPRPNHYHTKRAAHWIKAESAKQSDPASLAVEPDHIEMQEDPVIAALYQKMGALILEFIDAEELDLEHWSYLMPNKH